MSPPTKIISNRFDDGNLLHDKDKRNRPKYWREYKLMSQILGTSLTELGYNKGDRVSLCSCWLMFKKCPEDRSHPKRLKTANFCGVRLCPSCQKRRSFIEYRTMLKIHHAVLADHPTMKFLFLTLTVPNVTIERLGDELTHITKSWHKLSMRREVKRVIKASHRAIEITYNHKTNTYHPHIHIILAVNSRYFKSDEYIKHERWQEMWAESTGYTEDVIGSKLQVNIKRLSGEKGVSEACKYSLKPWNTGDKEVTKQLKTISKQKLDITYGVKGHMYIRNTPEETTAVVEKLHDALHGKKLTHYAGLFKDYKSQLKLKGGDEESDLTHGADEDSSCRCPICNAEYVDQLYGWVEMNKDYYACYY